MQNISTPFVIIFMWLIIIPGIIFSIFRMWCPCIIKTDDNIKVKSIFKIIKILNYALKHKEIEITRYDFDMNKENEKSIMYVMGCVDSGYNHNRHTPKDMSKLYECIYITERNNTFIIYYAKYGILNRLYYKRFIEKLSRRY